MKRSLFIWVALSTLSLVEGRAFAEKSREAKEKPAAGSSKSAPAREVKPVVVREEMDPETRFYASKLNTYLGIFLARTSAFSVGAQYGLAVDKDTPFYVGPEVNFSPGNVLMTLAGAWYEFRIFGAPRLSMSLGAVGGAAFTSQIPGFGGATYAFFGEACISQDIDDLVSVRGQFRPGTLGNVFSFMMNLNISFRFL